MYYTSDDLQFGAGFAAGGCCTGSNSSLGGWYHPIDCKCRLPRQTDRDSHSISFWAVGYKNDECCCSTSVNNKMRNGYEMYGHFKCTYISIRIGVHVTQKQL